MNFIFFKIHGEGLRSSKCSVLSVSPEQGVAHVIVDDNEALNTDIYNPNNPINIPLNLLFVPREKVRLWW